MSKWTDNKLTDGLSKQWRQRYGVLPLRESHQAIQDWFTNPKGQRLLQAEQQHLNHIMPRMYGYHLMRLSVLQDSAALSQQSPVTHHFSLGLQAESSPALAEFEHLPIDSESIDVALLHHCLEYSINPHQLLRETANTIIPNGYIIIVAFNPWSSSNFLKQCGRLTHRSAHHRLHNLRCSRLLDWLRLLGFETLRWDYGDYDFAEHYRYLNGLNKLAHSLLPITGSFYTIVARKTTLSMRVIKPQWKKQRGLPLWVKGSVNQQQHKNHKAPLK